MATTTKVTRNKSMSRKPHNIGYLTRFLFAVHRAKFLLGMGLLATCLFGTLLMTEQGGGASTLLISEGKLIEQSMGDRGPSQGEIDSYVKSHLRQAKTPPKTTEIEYDSPNNRRRRAKEMDVEEGEISVEKEEDELKEAETKVVDTKANQNATMQMDPDSNNTITKAESTPERSATSSVSLTLRSYLNSFFPGLKFGSEDSGDATSVAVNETNVRVQRTGTIVRFMEKAFRVPNINCSKEVEEKKQDQAKDVDSKDSSNPSEKVALKVHPSEVRFLGKTFNVPVVEVTEASSSSASAESQSPSVDSPQSDTLTIGVSTLSQLSEYEQALEQQREQLKAQEAALEKRQHELQVEREQLEQLTRNEHQLEQQQALLQRQRQQLELKISESTKELGMPVDMKISESTKELKISESSKESKDQRHVTVERRVAETKDEEAKAEADAAASMLKKAVTTSDATTEAEEPAPSSTAAEATAAEAAAAEATAAAEAQAQKPVKSAKVPSETAAGEAPNTALPANPVATAGAEKDRSVEPKSASELPAVSETSPSGSSGEPVSRGSTVGTVVEELAKKALGAQTARDVAETEKEYPKAPPTGAQELPSVASPIPSKGNIERVQHTNPTILAPSQVVDQTAEQDTPTNQANPQTAEKQRGEEEERKLNKSLEKQREAEKKLEKSILGFVGKLIGKAKTTQSSHESATQAGLEAEKTRHSHADAPTQETSGDASKEKTQTRKPVDVDTAKTKNSLGSVSMAIAPTTVPEKGTKPAGSEAKAVKTPPATKTTTQSAVSTKSAVDTKTPATAKLAAQKVPSSTAPEASSDKKTTVSAKAVAQTVPASPSAGGNNDKKTQAVAKPERQKVPPSLSSETMGDNKTPVAAKPAAQMAPPSLVSGAKNVKPDVEPKLEGKTTIKPLVQAGSATKPKTVAAKPSAKVLPPKIKTDLPTEKAPAAKSDSVSQAEKKETIPSVPVVTGAKPGTTESKSVDKDNTSVPVSLAVKPQSGKSDAQSEPVEKKNPESKSTTTKSTETLSGPAKTSTKVTSTANKTSQKPTKTEKTVVSPQNQGKDSVLAQLLQALEEDASKEEEPTVDPAPKKKTDNKVESRKRTRITREPIRTWENKYDIVHVVETDFLQYQLDLVHLNQARLDLFKTFTVPSMEQQTNQNYLWLIWVDPDLMDNFKKQLLDCLKYFPNAVVLGYRRDTERDFRELNGLAVNDLGDALFTNNRELLMDYYEASMDRLLLETRLDADDALNANFIESVQKQAVKTISQSNLDADYRIFCPEHHTEWRYYKPKDEENEHGHLVHYHNKNFCINSGLTIGYKTKAQTRHLNTNEQCNIAGVYEACQDIPGSEGQHYCVMRVRMMDKTEHAVLMSRTPTSAGMKRVLGTEDSFKGTFESVAAQKDAWSMVEKKFGVRKIEVRDLRKTMEGEMTGILQDALEGQCMPGHSCKSVTKRKLLKLLNKVKAKGTDKSVGKSEIFWGPEDGGN